MTDALILAMVNALVWGPIGGFLLWRRNRARDRAKELETEALIRDLRQ